MNNAPNNSSIACFRFKHSAQTGPLCTLETEAYSIIFTVFLKKKTFFPFILSSLLLSLSSYIYCNALKAPEPMTCWQAWGLNSYLWVACVCAHSCMHAIYKSVYVCMCTSSVSHRGIRLLLIQGGHRINWDKLQSPVIITVWDSRPT